MATTENETALGERLARLAGESEDAEAVEDDGLPLPEGTTVTRGLPPVIPNADREHAELAQAGWREAREAVRRVELLHEPTVLRDGYQRECFHDGHPWPCPTMRALGDTPQRIGGPGCEECDGYGVMDGLEPCPGCGSPLVEALADGLGRGTARRLVEGCRDGDTDSRNAASHYLRVLREMNPSPTLLAAIDRLEAEMGT